MRLLFAITVGCFCVLLWIALALARRIRLGQLLQARPARPVSLPREFFEAGEFRTPRPMHLEQEILQQKPRRPLSEITFSAERSAVATTAPDVTKPDVVSPQPTPIRQPSATYASLFGASVAIAQIDSHAALAVFEPAANSDDDAIADAAPVLAPVPSPVPFPLHRKQQQVPRQSGLRRRLDFSQYNNKDMGDLTDPYTQQLRGSGTQGPAPTNHAGR